MLYDNNNIGIIIIIIAMVMHVSVGTNLEGFEIGYR